MTRLFDTDLDAAAYSALSGMLAARYDAEAGTLNAHQNASNAPEYRDAYDAETSRLRRK